MTTQRTKPLVSVIVPVYQMEKYLELCMESLLGQTYNNLEILLIDDGSTDRSWELMQGYAARDKRVKIFQKPNGGLSDARNCGLQRMTGDYVAFVDADDYIDVTMYEKMLTKAVEEAADLVLCSYSRFETPGTFDSPRAEIAQAMKQLARRTHSAKEVYPIFFELGTTVWRGFFRTEFLKEYNEPFPKGLYYEDDYWHSFYRLRARRIAGIDEKLYYYRDRKDSISGGRKHSSHILEIFRRWEMVNGEYLEDAALKKAYGRHKVASLLHRLPYLLMGQPPQKHEEIVAGLQALIKNLPEKESLGLSKRKMAKIGWLMNASAWQIRKYIYARQWAAPMTEHLKSVCKMNLGEGKENYVQVCGVKVTWTPSTKAQKATAKILPLKSTV